MKKTKKTTKTSTEEPECSYWTDITYVCPKRGKVTEKVRVKKLKPQPVPETSPYELEILKEDANDDE